jgi:hypothetical protein
MNVLALDKKLTVIRSFLEEGAPFESRLRFAFRALPLRRISFESEGAAKVTERV